MINGFRARDGKQGGKNIDWLKIWSHAHYLHELLLIWRWADDVYVPKVMKMIAIDRD